MPYHGHSDSFKFKRVVELFTLAKSQVAQELPQGNG